MLLKLWTISAALVLMAASTMATRATTDKDAFLLSNEFITKKRSISPMMKENLVTPGSSDFSPASGSIRRELLKKRRGEEHGDGGQHGDKDDENENEKGSHRNEHSKEEKGEGEHGDRADHGREAKRHLKSRRRVLAKRSIDSFVQKVGFGVDGLIYKQDMINEKISGNKGGSTSKSGLPTGRNEKAKKAMSKAKSISSSAAKGDIKGMQNAH